MIDPYENYKEVKLKNGISLFYSEISMPWIKARLVVHGGAKDDLEGLEGTAHFVEHLLSHNVKGTTHKEMEEYLDDIGGYGSFGSTSYEFTHYSFGVPLENDNLISTLEFFGAMFFECKFENFIERERKIIIGEYNERFPIPLTLEILKKRREVLFGNHKIAKFLRPLGNLDSIRKISRDNIIEFYNRAYVPKNISIIATGGISLEEFVEILNNSKFGIEKEGERLPSPVPSKTLEKIKETHWHKSHKDVLQEKPHQAEISICVGLPGVVPNILLTRALSVLGETLYHEIREERGWSYSVNLNRISFPEVHDIHIGIDYPWEHEDEIENIIDECVEKAILDTEMIEKQIRRSINSFKICDISYGKVLANVHNDIIDFGYIKTYKNELSELEGVKTNDVVEVLKMFKKDNRFIMTIGS